MRVRPAHADELAMLSDLCLRSKAHWGYEAAFLEACRAELTLGPGDLSDDAVAVVESEAGVVGVAQVSVSGEEAELEKLFVEPAAVGEGLGRRLFDWAVEAARAAGARRLVIAADPDAAPIYRAMGAVDAGDVASMSIPGRMLPRLVFDLQG